MFVYVHSTGKTSDGTIHTISMSIIEQFQIRLSKVMIFNCYMSVRIYILFDWIKNWEKRMERAMNYI